ncbi:COG1470 family protein [Paenibacillus puerhi]|uniref:COG1470 family protein n=1 Tax=Paenibacillus puerhi TaxID=2692622 RepID=UPI001356B78E|nr:heparinase II/III family protein [Paenibacillus puerhi]
MNAIENLACWKGLLAAAGNPVEGAEPAVIPAGTEAVFEYDRAEDWRSRESIRLEVRIPEGQTLQMTFRIYPLAIGRPEYLPCATATIAVAGTGWTPVEVLLEQFDSMRLTSAYWRMVQRVGVEVTVWDGDGQEEIPVRSFALAKKGQLDLYAAIRSRSAEPGETVAYELLVSNEGKEEQAVVLSLEAYGFESMDCRLEPDRLLLKPGETRAVTLTASVHEGIAPGGYEKHTVKAVPNGDAGRARKLDLYTVRKLPRPYILHTETGWDEVRSKLAKYEWAREKLDAYIKKAEEWSVPQAQGPGAAYAFELGQRFYLHAAGVAWKLTGRKDLLDKVILFYRRFADPAAGYPATDAPVLHIYASREEREVRTPRAVKVCSGEFIHEGEFMLDAASVYDLVRDADGWEEEDHIRIEAAFRLFLEKADWKITDGDTNNIPSGGMVGALLCSLAIQDMHWMQRFLEGPGGFADMVATGVMDDGWYFEGATNYVLLFADMFTRLAHACEPWGLNLKNRHVPPSYCRNAMLSPWSMPREKPFLGMSFEKFGPVRRNFRTVKDLWDAILPFVDYRGILFGTNDSTDKDIVHLFDLAYYVWRDPGYIPAIAGHNKRRDLLYGVGELPAQAPEPAGLPSAKADNIGLAVLRSQKAGTARGAQYQAVLKYGSHGGYHGHFDRTGLAALSRYGRSAFSPMASWYGYSSFMFKMWVQTSLAHNMVAVDQRMQEPKDSRSLLFHAGRLLQASVVETVARWSEPPYGGQTPYPESFPEERSWQEGRDMPVPAKPRSQGDIGEYSEPILQRRLLAVTDDYIVVADFLSGEQHHEFDCLYHFQGYEDLEAAGKRHLGHSGQMNQDPYGAGQFITDCDWYACDAPALLRFSHDYDGERDDRDGRHCLHSEPGSMKLNLHALWPPQQRIMTGWYPEADRVNKRLFYEVLGDGYVLEEGRFGAWTLGKRHIRVALHGLKELRLRVKTEGSAKKTIFWGDPHITLADGCKLPLSALPVRYDNVDRGHGVGVDYYGGPVHLQGELYPLAEPFEPTDQERYAEAIVDLTGVDAAAFEAVIGGDYPLGLEPARRKTVSLRAEGKQARFLTVLELHEGASAIERIEAPSYEKVSVTLKDGRVQHWFLEGLDGDGSGVGIRVQEMLQGKVIREESC